MTDTMWAYALKSFDDDAEFVEVPLPTPGPRQVRVRVLSSSVNPVDVATSTGAFRSMYEYRFPSVLGRDFAGTVDAVGVEVTAFRPGDEVFGMVKRNYIGDGTFAEFVIVDEDRFLIRRPAGLGVTAAGSLGLAGVTALQCVQALSLQPGATVFINGATGGVGAFAIQIAVAGGLNVIATAQPGDEETHVRELGATDTVDWSVNGVTDAVRQLRPEGVDGVIDLVSRDNTSFAVIAATAVANGTAVTTLGAAQVESSGGPSMLNIHSDSDPELLQQVANLVATGSVRVPLVDVFPVERIGEAFALLATAPRGKVGLTFKK